MTPTTPTSTHLKLRSPDRRLGSGARLAAALAVVVVAAVASFALVRAVDPGPSDAELLTEQDLPADVRAELDTVWGRFTTVFAGRRQCMSDVTVELVGVVDGGDARYVADGARIEIRIPTTPARFRESVAHELAHHVDHTCDAFGRLRAELHGRLGGTELPWASGNVWEDVPAERYAEAVVELVNGERVRHADEVLVDSGTVELIAAWGQGDTIGD